MESQIEHLPVERLRLDAENPRLPEHIRGKSQSDLLAYLFDNAVLDELVESLIENGYFDHEPLIVLPLDAEGRHVVVEGNRRLAALMLIHGFGPTEGYYPSVEISEEQKDRLLNIPSYIVKSRDEVRKFLGYRHISGLKPWSPEAKARYLTSEVNRASEEDEENPFLHVARMVGSNTVGVRNSYSAFSIIQQARDECDISIGYLLEKRFGVWLRCLNSSEIRDYISFGSPKTFEEVQDALKNLDCGRLKEVVSDLTPSSRDTKPILADSRQVTEYGLILQNEAARRVLRRYESVELASQVVQGAALPDRVAKIRQQIEALSQQVQESVDEADPSLVEEAASLVRAARLFEGAVKALQPTD